MPIPDFQKILLPLLKFAADDKEHNFRESVEFLSHHFQLSEEEKEQMLPSGSQTIFENRVGWAKTHLVKAGLLESLRRSIFKITPLGKELLSKNPDRIDVSILKSYSGYTDFIKPNNPQTQKNEIYEQTINSQMTPVELLDESYQKIKGLLSQDLLEKVKKTTPPFFERLVIDLLVKMGYGGSIRERGHLTKKTKDEGIDGIIKEDKLGLDSIYIQAKRWDKQPVGRKEIQSFVGSLTGQRANKGIFITTTTFTKEAKEYVDKIDKKVILIDGLQLTNYMIDYGLGVNTVAVYEIKRIDNDYFEE